MESSYNNEPFLSLDSMLEVSLVEGHTTSFDYGIPNVPSNNSYNKQKYLQSENSKALHWNADEEEEIFYEDLFEDLSKIRNLRLHCTKCDVHLGCYEGSKLYKHMHLGVLLCQKCFNFYANENFTVGEDGSDMYCRWCGEGGTVICCSNCPNVFCKNCISHNFSKNVMSEINASSEWLCFLCNFRSLWEHRAVCRAAITYAASDPEIKQQLANISPRPGDDAKYCCSIDMDQSRLKPKLLRSSMPSQVMFAKFLNIEQSKVKQKKNIHATGVCVISSTSANVTISERTSENPIQEATPITKVSFPKNNLAVGVPFSIHAACENQKYLKLGNVYQIQSSNLNCLPPFSIVHGPLIVTPSDSVQPESNASDPVLNKTSLVPSIKLPIVRSQYDIIANSKPIFALQNPVTLQILQNIAPLQTIQNYNIIHPTHIHQSVKQSVKCPKPINTSTSVVAGEKQIPSKNHILPLVSDDYCQINGTTGLNNVFNTNLSGISADNMDSSASSIINKKNNDYISYIRVRSPAMQQSVIINESGTNKFLSSEHSQASKYSLTSPDLKSQMLKDRHTQSQIIGNVVIKNENNQMDVVDENHTLENILNTGQIMGIRVIKRPKSSTERGRDFRARRRWLKQKNELLLKADSIRDLLTEENQSSGPYELKIKMKRTSAERTRRWRERKKIIDGIPNNQTKKKRKKKQAKTAAERMREYRERKKKAMNIE